QEHVAPGTFVAGVGADNEDKQELDPRLLASSKVVADVLEQCAEIGDLHHAIAAGLMQRGDVHAELAEVVAGKKAGRTSQEEITIFDSTGTALQDVAAAAVVYERARNGERGGVFRFWQDTTGRFQKENARSLHLSGKPDRSRDDELIGAGDEELMVLDRLRGEELMVPDRFLR